MFNTTPLLLRFLFLLSGILILPSLAAQTKGIPHPKDVFGFTPGDDYKLATYDQMLEYYQKLDVASGRVVMQEIGKSVLGKPLLLLFISSEENLRQLDKWQNISEQLARARIEDETAQQLAKEGKAIVWIDGGLHATEVAGAQMTPLLAHRVVTEETSEMQAIRENTIMLLMPVMNPDGLDIVANWYKYTLKTPYEMTRPPWLYHHFIGHDNNRDWFMNNMPESRAVTDVLYNQWYPQIVYNHHQTSPTWTRIFIPPFADPVNPNIHPGVTTGVNMVGSAMANRFAMKKMPGAVSGAIYSMWWNGGMRTVPYFHNMVGILTETGHATPTPRYYDPDSIPSNVGGRRGSGYQTNGTNIFYAYPWEGGWVHFRTPVNYMLTASMAVLRLASDLKEQWLYNIYDMGKDGIEQAEDFAYIIPAKQWDSGEAHELINILRLGGIEIQEAKEDFTADGKNYAAGDFIIPMRQAFRSYAVDLLEKQAYPNRKRNGVPETPYDLAGWTLPMQMGVEVVKVKEAFEINGMPITQDVYVEAGSIAGKGSWYSLSHKSNNSILAINRLLKAGAKVYLASEEVDAGKIKIEAGTFVVESEKEEIEKLSADLGLDFQAMRQRPEVALNQLKAAKIGLYKSWVGNMDEGWTRWLLKEYEFDVDTLHDADIQTGDLSRYHAIILPHQSSRSIIHGHAPNTMPEQFTGGLELEGTLALKNYIEQGGTLVALDAASDYAIEQFALPVRNAVSGTSSQSFFIPGSLVRMNVNTDHPLAYGMQEEVAASFVRSRAFQFPSLSRKREGGWAEVQEAPKANVEVIARYAEKDILMSGWAMGENKYLKGKAAMVRVPMGKGSVILYGFRTQFRGQARGTYKLLFNALQGSTMNAWPTVENIRMEAKKEGE